MKIYEKKHFFTAAQTTCLISLIVVICVAFFLFLPHQQFMDSTSPFWRIILLLIAGVTFVGMLFTGCLRTKRYIDLCIKGNPAVIISDQALQIYYPFGEDTVIPWEEIADFETYPSKDWTTCRPIYKDKQKNKWRYLKHPYRDAIRTDYLDIPEEKLLEILRLHLTA